MGSNSLMPAALMRVVSLSAWIELVGHCEICGLWDCWTHSDFNAIIGEDESCVARCEFGSRHCDDERGLESGLLISHFQLRVAQFLVVGGTSDATLGET